MHGIFRFFRGCVCLSLPIGVYAAAALLAPKSLKAQTTNQSDITGQIITTVESRTETVIRGEGGVIVIIKETEVITGSTGNPHAPGTTGNPHTPDNPTGNPHTPDNPTGNPHTPGETGNPHKPGQTGNPHTPDNPTGNPHTPDNPTGNPHGSGNQSDGTGPIIPPGGTNQSDGTGPLFPDDTEGESSEEETSGGTTVVIKVTVPGNQGENELTPTEVVEDSPTVEVTDGTTGGTGTSQPTSEGEATGTPPTVEDTQPSSPTILVVVPGDRDSIRGNGTQFLGDFINLDSINSRFRILRAWTWGSWGGMIVRIGTSRVLITLAGVSPGISQDSPVLPTGMDSGRFSFVGVVTGVWVDPPTAEGFRYTTTSDSLFTEVVDFPTGFGDRFTVSVGNQVIGEYGPGESVDFRNFPGGGVREFSITGITPLADAYDPMAFPLRVAFNTETADFTMEAIEDPAAVQALAENPPAPEPFQVSLRSPDQDMDLVPSATAQVLREQATRLMAASENAAQNQVFSAAINAVETDLVKLSASFPNLFPEDGGLNLRALNPTMDAVSRLRRSLPQLLEELNAYEQDGSAEQAEAIAQMLQEVDGMTTLLETMTPMLSDLSESVATAK